MPIIERGEIKEDEVNPLEEEEEDEDEDYDENIRLIKEKIYGKKSFHGESSHINPAFEDDDLKTSLLGIESLNKVFREELKKDFSRMNNSVEVSQKKGRLSIRIWGSETKWTPVFTLKGEINKKMTNELKKALGPSNKEIIIGNDEKIKSKTQRKEELELQEKRTDISEEVRDTTKNEINENEIEIDKLKQENAAIKSKMSLRDRIKDIFEKHGVTVFSISIAIGTVIGVIVSNLKSGLASVTKGVGNGLKAIGKKLAKILPGMIGAIASFIFRIAGEAIGFLAKNSWLLILFLVTYAVEQYRKKKK